MVLYAINVCLNVLTLCLTVLKLRIKKFFIKNIKSGNDQNTSMWNRGENILSNKTLVGLKIEWLRGLPEKDTMNKRINRHPVYIPICGDVENKWENIWKD